METMMKLSRAVLAALIVGGIFASVAPANAIVYCKTAGVPRGCVARAPATTAVVHAPATRAVVHGPVVYCKRVGYPKGCVMR
jgi:hypothetical protein